VEFVGHPMVGRFTIDDLRLTRREPGLAGNTIRLRQIALLPGSRKSELKRHLPPMLGAFKMVQEKLPGTGAKIVLPNQVLTDLARKLVLSPPANLEMQTGNLPQALAQADIAIAKTGTVTMECAFFGVPTVTLYKGSWLNYQIARHLITVETFTMPNLLANEEVYPEFLQNDLTAENVAGAALDLLQNEARRQKMRAQLAQVIASLGGPGAPARAADALLSLLA
jgi:lipid-A-disaccharide synthase